MLITVLAAAETHSPVIPAEYDLLWIAVAVLTLVVFLTTAAAALLLLHRIATSQRISGAVTPRPVSRYRRRS